MTDKLTVSDVRAAGFCVRGLRRWYEDQQFEVPFREFLRDGVPLEMARGFGDPQIDRAVKEAEARIAREARG